MGKRQALIGAVALLLGLLGVEQAEAAATCSFSSAKATITMAGEGAAVLSRDAAGAILVDGAQCQSATVSNTDTIAVGVEVGDSAQQTVTIDLSGGALAPGISTEASGLPEIEIEVDAGIESSFTPDRLVVRGTGGEDTFRFGSAGFDLNADGDADVTGPAAGDVYSTRFDAFELVAGAGADTISGAGGGGLGNAFPFDRPTELRGGAQNDSITGGAGNDLIVGGAGDDTEAGGDGTDVYDQESAPNGADTVSESLGGFDRVEYDDRANGVSVDLDGVADDGEPGELDNISSGIEYVWGGPGNDVITDNSGELQGRELRGGAGADRLNGGIFGDRIIAGNGADIVHGGEGGDQLYGDAGGDDLYGEGGDDTFFEDRESELGNPVAANGADDIFGGSGTQDRVLYERRAGAHAISLDDVANDGQDSVPGGAAEEGDNVHADTENVNGAIGPNRITGSAVRNEINGGAGADVIRSLGGNDSVAGSYGADTLYGGAGDDLLSGWSGPGDQLFGEADNDTLQGSSEGDVLEGGPGADTVEGNGGDDTILEGATPNGADELRGGDGVDLVSYSDRTARVVVTIDGTANDGEAAAPGEGDNVDVTVENLAGGAGNDSLTGSAADNVIDGGRGADVVTGGDGFDTTTYASRTERMFVNIDGQPNDGADVNQDGVGEEGDNVTTEAVVGGRAGDLLVGGAGPNTLDGYLGNDKLMNGPTFDSDVYRGDEGVDTVSYEDRLGGAFRMSIDDVANDGPSTGLETDNITTSVENLIGSSDNDVMVGSAAANRLEGGPGADRLTGLGGPDVMMGGAGRFDYVSYSERTRRVLVDLDGVADDGDPLVAPAGERDNVYPDVENLAGGQGADGLTGSASSNTLEGEGGNDWLVGGLGADSFRGGNGSDTVDYSARTVQVSVDADGAADDGEDANDDGVAEEGDFVPPENESIVGGEGNDELGARITGGGRLFGQGGDDVLFGGNGNDFLDGGLGADTLFGSEGIDTASYDTRTVRVFVDLAESGNDGEDADGNGVAEERDTIDGATVENVLGGSGSDKIRGTWTPNRLEGGLGADLIRGLDGDDTLLGGGGDDMLDGGLNKDVTDGGPGIDTTRYDGASDFRSRSVRVTLDGVANDGTDTDLDGVTEEGDNALAIENVVAGFGRDIVVGNNAPNTLFGLAGNDDLGAGGGNDVLIGGDGDDTEEGGAGDDTFRQLSTPDGADDMYGEEGADRADYSLRTSNLHIVVDHNPDDGAAGENDLVNLIERVDAGSGNDYVEGADVGLSYELDGGAGMDTLIGGPGIDLLTGGTDDDSLYGREDGDTLRGGGGWDTLDGETGDDSLYGEEGADTLRGWTGDDVLDGGLGADTFEGHDGRDVITGGPNGDRAWGGADSDTVNGGDGNDDLDGQAGFDQITGGPGNDLLHGGGNDIFSGDESDRMVGNGGDDRLYGGRGLDTMDGNDGRDELYGEEGCDRLDGGLGPDVIDGGGSECDSVSYRSRANPVVVVIDDVPTDGENLEGDFVKRGTERIEGGAGNDQLTGDGSKNVLCGKGGEDVLSSLGGDDALVGGDGNDRLVAGDGNDFLGTFDDTVGAFTCGDGDAGEDDMRGQNGDDTFAARDGVLDYLFGGPGTDGGEWDNGLDVLTGIEG